MKRLMSVKMMRPQLLLPMVIFYQQWIFVWFYWQEHKSRPHQCPSILNHRSIFLKGCFTLKQQLLKQLRVKLFVEKNKMRSCILICHSFVSTFCCFFFVIFIVLFVAHRKATNSLQMTRILFIFKFSFEFSRQNYH